MIPNKVVIVGAGLAGLYAAYLLEQRKIPYLLLEAKSNPGGRILGVSSGQYPDHHFDLGPAWIFPHQHKIQALCSHLTINLFNQYASGDVLYQRSAQQAPQQIHGAGDLDLFKIQGGSQSLVSALHNQLSSNSVKLSHTLTGIERQGNTWQLTISSEGSKQTIHADELVLAMPPRIIAPYFSGKAWISQEVKQSLQASQTWMAGQAKFVASYANAFWRSRGLSGQMFSQVGPLIETHDASTDENKNPALFGFIGWPPSLRSQMTEQQLKEACLAQLVSCFGPEAKEFTECHIKDWSTDEFIATENDKIEASRHPEFDLSAHLEELSHLHLHFIGSEFAQQDPGYLEGAINAAAFGVKAILSSTSK